MHSSQHTGDFRNLAALWIAVIYTLSAFVWVLASNWFLASQVRESDILPHGNTAATLTQLQNIKGWLSALISAWLLYFVVGQLVGAIKKAEKRAQDAERWFGSAFDSNPRPMAWKPTRTMSRQQVTRMWLQSLISLNKGNACSRVAGLHATGGAA